MTNEKNKSLIEAVIKRRDPAARNRAEAEALIKEVADVNFYAPSVINYPAPTPLGIAASNDDEDLIRLLLGAGANIRFQGGSGIAPLSAAAMAERCGAIRLLISKGADVNLRDSYGKTALMWAAECSRSQAVHLLLEKGANVDLVDDTGKTALMLASAWGKYVEESIKIIHMLAEKSDVNLIGKPDNRGLDALDYAKKRKFGGDKITNALKEHIGEKPSRSPLAFGIPGVQLGTIGFGSSRKSAEKK